MIWLNAFYLWLLLLIPASLALFWWFRRRNEQIRSRFFDDRLLDLLRNGLWQLGERLKTVCIMVALALFIIGLAGPRIGTEVRDIQQRGVDLITILDLSSSMNAEDIRPSRLRKAKFEIQRLIERSTGDRIGLIVFTGQPYIQSPMTLDHSALRLFLDITETHQMPGGSTNISAAFEMAAGMLESLEGQNEDAAKVVLLFSDGEDHGPPYDEALEALTSQGVFVFTVGIGTRQGARVPVYDRVSDEMTGFVRNDQGEEVVSTLQSERLREIAQRGNGTYYEISGGTDGIDAFLARLDELQQGEFSSREYADYANRYQLLLIAGLLFLTAGILIPGTRNKSGRESRFTPEDIPPPQSSPATDNSGFGSKTATGNKSIPGHESIPGNEPVPKNRV